MTTIKLNKMKTKTAIRTIKRELKNWIDKLQSQFPDFEEIQDYVIEENKDYIEFRFDSFIYEIINRYYSISMSDEYDKLISRLGGEPYDYSIHHFYYWSFNETYKKD